MTFKVKDGLIVGNTIFVSGNLDVNANNINVADSITVGNFFNTATVNSSFFTGIANAANFLNGKAESALAANSAVYATNAQFAYTANVANFLNGYNSDYFTNATNITTGTLAEPRLPFRMDQDVRTVDNVEFRNLTVTGDVYFSGNTTRIDTNSVVAYDSLIYLNNAKSAEITGAYGNGVVVTYVSNNNFSVSEAVIITGMNPETYNLYSANSATIETANSTHFTVSKTTTDIFVSGGTAYAKAALNPDVGFVAGLTIDNTYQHVGFFRDATDGIFKAFDGLVAEPDGPFIDMANARIADIQANTIYADNAVFGNGSISSSLYSGTANNATHAYGKQEEQLSVAEAVTANNSTYAYGKQEEQLYVANAVFATTANNSLHLNGKQEQQLSVDTSNNATHAYGKQESQLYVDTANNASHAYGKQESQLYVANAVFATTANNSLRLNGKQESQLYVANAVFATTANTALYLGGFSEAYFTNASNITTGTLPWEVLPPTTVNTSSAVTVSNTWSFQDIIIYGGINVANSFGDTNQVLASNGSGGLFWKQDQGAIYFYQSIANTDFGVMRLRDANNVNNDVLLVGNGTSQVFSNSTYVVIDTQDEFVGTVTSVDGGSGLLGGPITDIGSLYVGAGDGISVNQDDVAVNAKEGLTANSSGLWVNTAYFSLLSREADANNSLHLQSRTWESPGSIGYTTPNDGRFLNLQANALSVNTQIIVNNFITVGGTIINSTYFAATANNSTYAYGKQEEQLSVAASNTALFLDGRKWESPFAIGSTVANSGAFTNLVANIGAFTDLTVYNGIYANASFGNTGQVLTSNGTAVFWANSSVDFVANAEFATTANNALFAYGKQESQLFVAYASLAQTAVLANNSTYAYGKQEEQLSVASSVTSNNSTYAYGKQEEQLYVANAVFATTANNSLYAYGKQEGQLSVDQANNADQANNSTYAYGKQEGQLYVANAVFATTANNSLYAYGKQEEQLSVANAVFTTTANNSLYAYGKQEEQLSVASSVVSNNSTYAYGKQESQLFVANAVFATTANNSLYAYGKQESQLFVANAVFATTANNSLYAYGKQESQLFVANAVFATTSNNSLYAYGKQEEQLSVASSAVSNNATYAYGKQEGQLSVATSNNSTYAYGKQEEQLSVASSVVSNNATYAYGKQEEQLSVANSIFSATANNSLYAYGKQEEQLYVANAVFATTANNSLYAYGKQEAQLYVANAVFATTANNALRLNGKQEAQLYVANAVFATTANNSLYAYGKQEEQLYVANAVFATFAGSVAGGVANAEFADTANNALFLNGANSQFYTNATNITTGTLAEARLPFRMDQNVRTTDDVFFANGIFSGTVSVGGDLILTGNLISTNIQSLAVSDPLIKLGANNPSDVLWGGFTIHYNGSGNTTNHAGLVRNPSTKEFILMSTFGDENSVFFNDTINIDDPSFSHANLTIHTLRLGNTSSVGYLDANSYSGTANNAFYAYGKQESQLSVATAASTGNAETANNATYAYGKQESQLSVASAVSAISSSSSANTDALQGRTWQSPFGIGTVSANSGAFTTITASGNVTLNSDVRLNAGLIANNSIGIYGQVLSSNGSSIYWTNANNISGTVSNANNSNYLNGKQESQLSVANAVFATTANNALYAYGKQESQLSVANAVFAATANNSLFAYGKQESQLSVSAANNSSFLQTRTWATPFAIGSATANSGTFTTLTTSANAVFNGNTRFNGGVSANGSFGANSNVLTSNGTGVYWASSFVDYVANAGFSTTANNALFAYGKQESQLSVSTANNSSFLQTRTWATPFAIGSTVANTGAFTTLTSNGNITQPFTASSATAGVHIGYNTEGVFSDHPFLTNDLGNLRLRGGTSTANSNYSLSNSQFDSLFDGAPTYCTIDSTTATFPMTLEFTLPKTLFWSAYVGISFGNAAFRAQTLTIETFTQGAWITCYTTTSFNAEQIVVPITGNAGIGTTRVRFTFSNPATVSSSGFRIANIWGFDYASDGWSQLAMPRAGGTMYGGLTVNGPISGAIGSSVANTGAFTTVSTTGDIQQQNANYLRGRNSSGTSTRLFGVNSANTVYVGGIDLPLGATLFVNNGVEQMRIESSGNVSIGSTATPTKLFVNGHMSVANGFGLFANGTLGTPGFVLTSNGSSLYWATASTASNANNASFLQTRTWATPFAIGSSVANTGAFTSLTASANVNLDSGTLFTDATNNRVGINNTNPTTSLHVQGGTLIGGDGSNTYDFKLQRLNGGIRAVQHDFSAAANSPWILHGENLTWTGERSGTVESTQAHRPYYEAFAPIVGYKEFGFANVTSGNFTGSNLIPNLVLTSGGNVAIGSTAAPTKLFVNGHMSVANGFGIYANGTLGASGLVLTSNGTSLFWGSTANNANFLQGRTWATPFAIGSSVANTGAFTTLTASANVNLDSGTLFVDGPANRVGVGTTIPSSRFQVGTEVVDDFAYAYDGNTVIVVHQQPTSTTVLNDPKETLLLARQGTGGQAYGAAASFDLSRYENNSVNSRTRLDFKLAHNSFLATPTIAMTMLSSGNVGLGGNTTPGQTLQVDGSVGIKNGLVANGVMGASGTVLTSNGSTIYWAPVSGTIETANNALHLEGRKWATPFAIGSTVANTGAFTTITTSSAGATGINITTDTSLATHSGRMFWTNDTAGQGVGIYNSIGIMTFSTGATPGAASGTTRMTINSGGVIQATTAGGSFRAPIFYDSDNTAYYFDGTSTGTSINVVGDIIAGGDITANGGQVFTNALEARVKLSVWNSVTYGIGMQSGYTYGGIGNDYVMSFQMSNTDTRGFWWGDLSHTNAQGAMALTTNGKLTVAHSIRVGFGEADTTVPGSTYALEVNGAFAATTKSFVINHPTKPDMKLRYGSLEGPENGVYVRGRLKGNTIELPDYWTGLVDEDTITVNLTPIGKHQNLYVESIADNKVVVGNDNLISKKIDCFYVVYGERNDVEKLVVEY